MKMKENQHQQFEDQELYMDTTSPFMKSSSETTTPERTDTASSLSEPLSSCHSPTSYNPYHDDAPSTTSFKPNKDNGDPRTGSNKKLGRKSHSFAYRIRDHVKMGPKLSETVKGKLSLGARIIQLGGRENIFRKVFGMSSSDGEKLLKASQCYLSTTAGPIAGILFISTHKLAFCSERSIILPSNSTPGEVVRTPYKVSIPIKKIKGANESENVNKPAQKYIEIVTEDNFEFWFMGFVRFEKAFLNIHKAISMSC
ncbi:putative GEM-like protein 8 [Rhododendron vialii]|uniref:putative GEM-like protein 8 n=1 Tax=Rhododendron vialii TaxID=182163 RepID=UPI00265FB343|nr:putative GEM-like protein 8 [Rhododendron vialii]